MIFLNFSVLLCRQIYLEKKQQRSNYFFFPVVLQMAHVLRQLRLNK